MSRAFKAAPVATPICKNRDFAETSRPVISKLKLTPTAVIYSPRLLPQPPNGSFARSFSSHGRRTPCWEVQTRCSGVRAFDRCDRAGKTQAVIDDQTPCSAAVEAFDSHDKKKMREAVEYIESIFGQLDQRERDTGEPGMLAQPNDREGSILMSIAVGLCRQHQKETIRNVASRAYRVVRTFYGLSSAPEK
jgi:hypothetical protein